MGLSSYDTIERARAQPLPAAMRVLVTGGAGFIGQHLRRALGVRGHEVRSYDVERPANAGAQDVAGDLLNGELLRRATDGTDTIVHLAAKHRFFGVSPEEFQRVNVEGTRALLQAAARANTRRIVFYSSVAVYGDYSTPTNELSECRPAGPYGRTKLAAERLVEEWAAADDRRQAIVIRPTVVFGAGNRGNIFRLIRQIDRGLFAPVGPGDNIKSVAYVDNLVDATLFLLGRQSSGVETYNYADEPHLTFRQTTEIIHRCLGRPMRRFTLPVRPILMMAAPVELLAKAAGRDIPIRAAIEKINRSTHHSAQKIKSLGFTPRVGAEEGLSRMVDWYRSTR
jgi:nucleoside-diphosphate-sugar epimerase